MTQKGVNNSNFKGGKVKCICSTCGKKFEVYPSRIRSGGGKFCSKTCAGKDLKGQKNPSYKGGKVKCVCPVCNKNFEVYQYRAKNGKNIYCSAFCAATAMNKGGKKASDARTKAKRRGLGHITLNTAFESCEGHHITHKCVIYISQWLHQSMYHNLNTRKNMFKLNALVLDFLLEGF